jgi:putative chitinase
MKQPTLKEFTNLKRFSAVDGSKIDVRNDTRISPHTRFNISKKYRRSDYEINTPQRIAAFIAQCAHESGGFVALKENLNYKAATLRKIFGKYFPNDEIANQYASLPNKQEAIANKVYANRMGNGDEASGDGFRYCGRGLIQLTGKSNYQSFADSLEMNVEDVPEYLQTFEGAAQSACWFWETNNLNQWADKEDILTLKSQNKGLNAENLKLLNENYSLRYQSKKCFCSIQ